MISTVLNPSVQAQSMPLKISTPLRFSAGGRVPWDVYLAQNQVLNRELIDWTGFIPWSVIFSRNKYEKIEKLMDGLTWVGLGVACPVLLDQVFNRQWTKGLLKSHPEAFLSETKLKERLPHKRKARFRPMGVPFELLDRAGFDQRFLPGSKGLEQLKDYGLKNLSETLRRKLLRYKVGLLTIDLFIMTVGTLLYNWGKNWFTEKASGKKGFSGEFEYTSEEYRKAKSSKHEKEKVKKLWTSMGISAWSVVSLPLILYGLLQSQKMSGGLKRVIPAFNYYDVIYMSKWTMLWQGFFSYTIGGMLAARDSHEVRETGSKTAATNFFYIIGDDIFAALFGVGLQQAFKHKLGQFKLVEKGRWGIPKAVSLPAFHELSQTLGIATAKPSQELARKLIRLNFFGSIASTALCLGISMNLLNNWYTKKKVLTEQNAFETGKNAKNELKFNPFESNLTLTSWGDHLPSKVKRQGFRLLPSDSR